MDRIERIYRDRGQMAKRALQRAKYLSGTETDEELKSDLLYEVAADFLADILYLIKSSTGKLDNAAIEEVTYRATEAVRDDALRLRPQR